MLVRRNGRRRKRHYAMPSERGRDPPSADDRDSPQDDQCVSEPTGRSCVSALSPPRAACSARRSQDCASVSQKGLSLASTAACAIRKRSEEHTSELQSLRHLVCRLLLEKKHN